ncbi:MAG: LamG domain-containing protein [Ignavibacteria bacterium]|nr:LamG domain-containing protein [Ignavibacteria bacterium]
MKSKATLKAILIGFFCLLVIPVNSLAGMDDDLIAYWSFDDCTAKDVSNNGNNGTIKNNVTCKDSKRTNSKSLFLKGNPSTFSSNGGHVLLPAIDFMSMPNYSVCLWVNEIKMEHFHGESYIAFGHYNSGMLTISHWYNEQLIFASGLSNKSPGLVVPFRPIDTKRFVHYCLVYDNGTVKGYRDRVFLGSVKQNTRIGTNDAALGRHWWYYFGEQTSTRFTGFIDDVRIYKRSLSEPEIYLLFNRMTSLQGGIQSMMEHTVTCTNNTTGQTVTIADILQPYYNCEVEGLLVKPDHNVTVTINGVVQ